MLDTHNKLLAAQISKILWEDWDPLELNSNPNLADEYEAYVPVVLSLLQQQADAKALALFLNKYFLIERDFRKDTKAAEKIVRLLGV